MLYLFNTSKAGKHFNNNWNNTGLFYAITHFSPSGGGDDDEGKKGGKKSCDTARLRNEKFLSRRSLFRPSLAFRPPTRANRRCFVMLRPVKRFFMQVS